jgi:hypothetical protein
LPFIGQPAWAGSMSGGRLAITGEEWLNGAWYMSEQNCSAANFQLQRITHLCTPPMASVPPGMRSRNRSRYQAMSPRYSATGGTSASQQPNTRPL